MTIEWNRVTRVSQIVAVVIFVGVFALGFWLGGEYQKSRAPDLVSTEAQ